MLLPIWFKRKYNQTKYQRGSNVHILLSALKLNKSSLRQKQTAGQGQSMTQSYRLSIELYFNQLYLEQFEIIIL